MMTIYIAGKIGQPAEGQSAEDWKRNYTEKFRYAQSAIETIYGHNVRNPVELPHDHDHTWESYMKECLIFMLSSDAVYALPDWSDSKGATIEARLAQEVGIPVYFDMMEIPVSPIPLCLDTTF